MKHTQQRRSDLPINFALETFVEPAMGSLYLRTTSDETCGQVMSLRGSAISLAVMLGPLTQAIVGPWITPQITFAIGVGLSLGMAMIALFLLNHAARGGKSEKVAPYRERIPKFVRRFV